jgi:glycosyltransferase involved in cell wall biosynthesis
MRIVLLAHAPVQGGSTDLLFQARDYFRRNHDVTTIFGESAASMDPRAENAVILPARKQGWRDTMRDYVKLVESHRPDIAYGIAGVHELDLFRFLRCVRVRHFSSLERHGYIDIPFWLAKYSGYFEAATANTPDALDEVRRLTGLPSFLLPYRLPPVDPAKAPVVIPETVDPATPVEIAVVSRLERFQKRAHWLPEIVRLCAASGTKFKWHFYGDGPEGLALRQKLQHADNVTFHGWMNRDALYREMQQRDIFFLCSRWEGLPIAMVEAMRCGLACVAPDIASGIHWTLSHGGGWLYDASSPRQAAAALIDAASDRPRLLQRRRDALRLSSELFPPSLAEDYYPRLEESFRALTSNGRVLDPATAPKFRTIPLSGYGRRLSYALETARYSPGRLVSIFTGRGRGPS